MEVLITSLDTKAYPYRAFALYARWGIEENYKREKQRLEIENFSPTPWVLLQDFHAKIFAQNLTAIFVRLAQWLAERVTSIVGTAINQLRQCAPRRRTTWSGFSWRLRHWTSHGAAYGRCSRGRAPRTQVPERHEKSPSPRIPDAVSKNTVRLKLMTLGLTLESNFFHQHRRRQHFPGGDKYNPTTSCSFSSKSGSLLTLNCDVR